MGVALVPRENVEQEPASTFRFKAGETVLGLGEETGRSNLEV